jgi:hypothetical protein
VNRPLTASPPSGVDFQMPNSPATPRWNWRTPAAVGVPAENLDRGDGSRTPQHCISGLQQTQTVGITAVRNDRQFERWHEGRGDSDVSHNQSVEHLQLYLAMGSTDVHGYGIYSCTWLWDLQLYMAMGSTAVYGYGIYSCTWLWGSNVP